MPFEQIPYTNFHGTNQDWMIQQIKQMIADWASYHENLDAAWAAYQDNINNWRQALDAAFTELHTYVHDYFDNLDVQQEINNKLDEFLKDGTLDAILLPYFNTYTKQINNTISNQNNKIDTLESRVNNFLEHTGTLGTEKDPELVDIRVGANGTTYASAGDAVREQISDVKADVRRISVSDIIEFTNGYVIDTHNDTVDATALTPASGYACAALDASESDVFTINGTGGAHGLLWCWIDSNGTPLSRSAANATATNLIIIAPAKSAKLILNTSDTSISSYYGYKPNRKIESIASNIGYNEDAIKDLQAQLNGYADVKTDFTYGVYEENGYASPATINYVHSKVLPAGDYIIQAPEGYQCEIFNYNSDTSGVVFSSWFSNKKNIKLTTPFVITIAKKPIADISEVESLKYLTTIQRFIEFPKLLDTINKNSMAKWNTKFKDYSFESIFSLENTYIQRTGITEKVYNKNFIDSPFAIMFTSSNTTLSNLEFRLNLKSDFNLVGVSEFLLPVYAEHPEHVNSITLTIEKPSGSAWSRSIGGSTLKKGWNYCRLFTTESNVNTWDTTTLIRVLCSYKTVATDVYIADIIAVRPNKGKIIFIDDHGYSNFYQVAYPELKALNVPVTWAIQPGALGASGGVAGKLTQAQIDELANDPLSEFSFHSWASDATASMSDLQIMQDTQKCITYLRKNGILPAHFWRAAWTQNHAENADASQYILEAYATPNEHYGYYNYPFPNRFDITRYQLHGNANFNSLFTMLRKTHCTVIAYTHDLDASGGIHMTPEEFSAFVTELTTALNDGYVECTSYNRLCMRYGNNEPYLIDN